MPGLLRLFFHSFFNLRNDLSEGCALVYANEKVVFMQIRLSFLFLTFQLPFLL